MLLGGTKTWYTLVQLEFDKLSQTNVLRGDEAVPSSATMQLVEVYNGLCQKLSLGCRFDGFEIAG
ncbi:MAG: hypothetical protein COA62_15545 [Rhodobiaceae bacterium]|nr:MAG: hypothetical protein COA62_15545 [Rhodobiaceae bacterium]